METLTGLYKVAHARSVYSFVLLTVMGVAVINDLPAAQNNLAECFVKDCVINDEVLNDAKAAYEYIRVGNVWTTKVNRYKALVWLANNVLKCAEKFEKNPTVPFKIMNINTVDDNSAVVKLAQLSRPEDKGYDGTHWWQYSIPWYIKHEGVLVTEEVLAYGDKAKMAIIWALADIIISDVLTEQAKKNFGIKYTEIITALCDAYDWDNNIEQISSIFLRKDVENKKAALLEKLKIPANLSLQV